MTRARAIFCELRDNARINGFIVGCNIYAVQALLYTAKTERKSSFQRFPHRQAQFEREALSAQFSILDTGRQNTPAICTKYAILVMIIDDERLSKKPCPHHVDDSPLTFNKMGVRSLWQSERSMR